MNRRSLLASSGLVLALAAAGCAELPKIPVEVKLPPAVLTLVDYANRIIAAIEAKVGAVGSVTTLIAQARGYIADLLAGKLDLKAGVGSLAAVLSLAAKFLPAPWNLAAVTLIALMDAFAGTTHVTARAAVMSPEQAMAILAQR